MVKNFFYKERWHFTFPINSFWLSLLLHLLALLLFLFFTQQTIKIPPKPPAYYVPAYTYQKYTPASHGGIQSPAKSRKASTARTPTTAQVSSQTKIPTRAQGESILNSSFQYLAQNQQAHLNAAHEQEPIYLVGDMSQAADPLIKLIGRALSAHFQYPEMAGRFGIRGRTVVGMVLHPEGYFSDIEIISSSQNHDLDAAALYAINKAPRVQGAERFINKPKYFVIGFIFN